MDLNNAIARAQAMMSEEFQQKVDAMAPSVRKKGGNTIDNAQMKAYENAVFGFGDDNTLSTQSYQQVPQQSDISKLPGFLQESAKRTPIGAGLEESYMASGLPMPSKPQVQSPIQMPSQNIQTAPVGGSVDYNYIKYLMESVIRENTGKINESAVPSFRGMRITEGNKFQFIDSKGNVYEGVLTLKKRANTK